MKVNMSFYYPFGMLQPERQFSSGKYRYGFQAQEKDDEIKGLGNSYNYTLRIHDPRLGRFLSIDPLSKGFPYNSPYAFSENRVIDAVELEGAETLQFEVHWNMGLASGNPVTGLVSYAVDWASDWRQNDIMKGIQRHAANVQQHHTSNGYTEHVPESVRKIHYKNEKAAADLDMMQGVSKYFTKIHIAMGGAMGGVEGTLVSSPTFKATSEIVRSLDDVNSLRGASWNEVENLIPKDWIKNPLNKGVGIKFVNPNKKGEQILLEKGFLESKDALHRGPYMKISKDGNVTRIPLEGNPTLKE